MWLAFWTVTFNSYKLKFITIRFITTMLICINSCVWLTLLTLSILWSKLIIMAWNYWTNSLLIIGNLTSWTEFALTLLITTHLIYHIPCAFIWGTLHIEMRLPSIIVWTRSVLATKSIPIRNGILWALLALTIDIDCLIRITRWFDTFSHIQWWFIVLRTSLACTILSYYFITSTSGLFTTSLCNIWFKILLTSVASTIFIQIFIIFANIWTTTHVILFSRVSLAFLACSINSNDCIVSNTEVDTMSFGIGWSFK